uniref:Uncharacterized protein n=1 Tax=Salix viminalis TaxID=40686 RepID=A0A6N2NJM5_SALVM
MALRIVYGAVILSFSCTFSKLLHLLLHPVFYFTSCYQYYSLTKRVVQASRVQTKQACLLGRHGCRLENSTLEFVLSGMRQDLSAGEQKVLAQLRKRKSHTREI